VFGRRRWRTPWSSGTSGELSSPRPVQLTWAPKTTRSPQAKPSPTPAEPAAPGTTPSSRGAGRPGADGSLGSVDPPATRVIRIPGSVGVEHSGDSASASGGAGWPRQRSPLALTAREAPSVDAPPWEQAGSDGQGRIAPAVISVVLVCGLLGGLGAFAATLGGRTNSSPGPAASIAPAGTTAPGGRAGTRVSGVGSKHTDGGEHHSGGGGAAAPLRTPAAAAPPGTPTAAPRRGAGKPTAKAASPGGAGRSADHQQPKEP
jgi:hypothetical protein